MIGDDAAGALLRREAVVEDREEVASGSHPAAGPDECQNEDPEHRLDRSRLHAATVCLAGDMTPFREYGGRSGRRSAERRRALVGPGRPLSASGGN